MSRVVRVIRARDVIRVGMNNVGVNIRSARQQLEYAKAYIKEVSHSSSSSSLFSFE